MSTNNYISVHRYALQNKISPQNVYRLIREGKLKDFKKEEVVSLRIRINENEIYNKNDKN